MVSTRGSWGSLDILLAFEADDVGSNPTEPAPPSCDREDGPVGHQIFLLLDQLRNMVNVTVISKLTRISGYSIGVHNWIGVRPKDILAETGVRSDAIGEDVIIAFFKDSSPMSEKARPVVPGKWGYKWISDIVGIELVDFNFKGKHESRGHSNDVGIPAS